MSNTSAIGIDIGASSIHVCMATESRPAKWPVVAIALDDPNWPAQLLAMLPGPALIALEPTGWHYSRPIITYLQTHASVQVFYVNHSASRATRAARISSQKTDPNDARALALKARDLLTTGEAHGLRRAQLEREALTIELRLYLRDHQRASRQKIQANNRLKSFAHGIWPALDFHSPTYLRALSAGACTPSELRALAARVQADPRAVDAYHNARARQALVHLVDQLPDDLPDPPAPIVAALQRALAHYQQASAELAALDSQVDELIHQPALEPVTAVWLTLPAVSPYSIATLHAATNCLADQLSPDEFRAAVGCHPCRQESGQVTESHDTKRGFKPAKAQLHLWTLRLLHPATPDNPVRAYFERLKDANNPNALHAARGKLTRLLSGLARALTPYDPNRGLRE